MLAAVSYIHTKGVAHLDLKPSNILLRHGRQVVLTDFELSRATTLAAHVTVVRDDVTIT